VVFIRMVWGCMLRMMWSLLRVLLCGCSVFGFLMILMCCCWRDVFWLIIGGLLRMIVILV